MQSEELTHQDTAPVAAQPVGPGGEPEGGHGEEGGHEHIHLPPPSIWPISMAGGIALAGMGLVTDWPVSVVGFILMFIALVNWIQELRVENPAEGSHEHH